MHLLKAAHAFPVFRLGHVVLTELGLADADFELLLARARDRDGGERVPFRLLEERWIAALAEGTSIDVDDLLPSSILCNPVPGPFQSRADVYALTHWLLYATDFGARPLPPVLDRDVMASLVAEAIPWQLAGADLDIMGELLMCDAIVGDGSSPASAAGWHAVWSAWSSLGFLPSPSFDANTFSAGSDGNRDAYAVANIYHTQFVFGMLCGLMLAQEAGPTHSPARSPRMPGPDAYRTAAGRCRVAATAAARFCGEDVSAWAPSPDYGSPGPDDLAAAAELVVASLDPNSRAGEVNGTMTRPEKSWVHALAAAAPADPLAVALLIDADLARAMQTYDLEALSRDLSITMLVGLAPSRMVLDSLEFLSLQQLADGAIGAHFVSPSNLATEAAREVTSALGRILAWAAEYLEGMAVVKHSPA